ncbi:MAG: FAD-dependent oxidoreductase [Gammaproteobacteria bacterium RIFCSPHIGHO2_12_FULL_38_14]|nr:MAG: FAD-dependent oxidoreductase [Gammaproteobacteria bacterium RIFCSPHIGHO2_12_FULL_38_14]
MTLISTDFLIIGGGIIGLSTARILKKTYPEAKIIVLEKEAECGLHASGRNSGVLHAGFYYTQDSLKAKFTRLGNQLLTSYCDEKKIPLNKCGKLVVANDESELPALDELLKRGRANGVILHKITEKEAREIEPRVRTYQYALFSPTTSSVNPREVLQSITQDAKNEGIIIHNNTAYLKRKNKIILTTKNNYQAAYVVNAAGLYADIIAKDFHFSKNYRILPFKGLYLYSNEPHFSIKTHIYPVPNLKNPFLGVHFTITVDGKIKIGPTAIPAFWREQYHRFENFKFYEFIDIFIREMKLFLFSNFDFKKLAIDEIKKYSKSRLVQLAALQMNGIKKENFQTFGKPGMRAQLLDVKKGKLEMDFVIEGDQHSMHVLNAVSPAFTSSIPFAQYVCDQIKKHIG